MKSLNLIFTSLGLLGTPLGAAETAPAKPNIIYLLSDDMGYGDSGFNGCKDILTPILDRLAKQGAVLEYLYGQPVCSPTRAALLTGRYPTHTGVYNVVSARNPEAWPLPLAERTLAQALREVGYTTAICGKWHLGEAKPELMPTRRGFDHQFGFMGGTINSFTHAGGAGSDPSKPTDWYRNDIASEDTGCSTHLITQEACRLIREQPADKPLFLYVAPNAVHTPWLSPDEYKESYGHLSKGRKELAGMASALEEDVGKIIAALTEKGMIDNTLIISKGCAVQSGGTLQLGRRYQRKDQPGHRTIRAGEADARAVGRSACQRSQPG